MPGRLILLTGVQAAGKTTLGRTLARRWPAAVHVDGDTIAGMVVSGAVGYDVPTPPAFWAQLDLRYVAALQVAAVYVSAGFDVVLTDNIYGAHLTSVVDRAVELRLDPYVVVLDPDVATVAGRETGRDKVGYSATVTPLDLVEGFRRDTPRRGLWLNTEGQTVAETVAEVEARLDEARVRPADPPTPPVLGVDGCRGGWIGALLVNGVLEAFVASSIADLVAQAGVRADVAVVAIDIPIGLPDRGARGADLAARAALGRKASSVFPTLTRATYAAPSYAEGLRIQREQTGKGFSKQAWFLGAKIRDVDDYLRGRSEGPEIIEVHPEVCFAAMSGKPILERKKDPAGAAARVAALRAVGLEPPPFATGHGYGQDDLLDACAAAWTAARHARGEAESLPSPPEVFSDGIPAAIWV